MSTSYQEDVKRLDSFHDLKANWDSYGAKPLDPATLAWTRKVLDRIHKEGLQQYLTHFGPSCTGAIEFEFEHADFWAALMITPKMLELVMGDREDEPEREDKTLRLDACEWNLAEIVGSLVLFFKQEAEKP